mgnify:FL=1
MKFLGRIIALVLVLVVIGVLIYTLFPGFRQRGREMIETYGGWTQEARQGDPVGFIDYAETKLEEHLAELRTSRSRLRAALEALGTHIDQTSAKLSTAQELAETFRRAYQRANSEDGFPVTVAGKAYREEQLVEQVELVLRQRRDYRVLLEEFRAATELAETRLQELVTRIASTKASLAMLPAKREVARVNELAGSTEELMAKVNDLIITNAKTLEKTGSPIRTVEELTESPEKKPPADAGSAVDARAFLEESS